MKHLLVALAWVAYSNYWLSKNLEIIGKFDKGSLMLMFVWWALQINFNLDFQIAKTGYSAPIFAKQKLGW